MNKLATLLSALVLAQAGCLATGPYGASPFSAGPLGLRVNGSKLLSLNIPSTSMLGGGFGTGPIYSDTPPWPGAIQYHDYYPTRYRDRKPVKIAPLTPAQRAHNQKAWENAARIWNGMPEPSFQGQAPGAWRGQMFQGVP